METFYSKPGGWLNRGGEWSPISINTLQSLQYSAPAQPLSQTRNNVSVRCFVMDLKLLTVTDYWVQRGVEGTELNLETVRKLQICRRKMRPVTRGCSVQLFKMWALSQLQDCYNNVLLCRCHHLKWASFILQTGGGKSPVQPTGNHPPFSVTSQKVLRKSLITSLGHFLQLDLWRVVQFQNVSCRQKLLHKWKVLHKQSWLAL